MVNGYVNAPKEFFDFSLDEMSNGIRLTPEDKLFNKFFEFVMAASHKVPVFAGTLYSNGDEESQAGNTSINVAGIYLNPNSQVGGMVAFSDITGGTKFIIQASPSEIVINQSN